MLIISQMRISDGKVKAIHSKKPAEGILDAANKLGANLIITGTRGLGTIRRTLMGSVSAYVLEHASVPVIICRPCEY
ncbi:hypothetical protein KUTeg_020753 [Tegillarca granosa]|uniref:UspA domain-containing protein n=1 Tax=Tegillarca granosa TaxID=220873 RepID=A0ABQ9ED61_TEGGR|nr:hypothetical protein KUTeg_020753 [Tegillarca granosa]